MENIACIYQMIYVEGYKNGEWDNREIYVVKSPD